MNAMRDDTPDERDSVLDDVDIHTVISGTERIPETVTDVIDAEGSAETASPPDAPAVVAWLFQEDAEPRQVALEELPRLAADDACFVWVDLSGYDPVRPRAGSTAAGSAGGGRAGRPRGLAAAAARCLS